jgi:hypothetical protein
MMPVHTLTEPFTECFMLGLVACLSIHYITGWNIILLAIVHLMMWFTSDMIMMHIIEYEIVFCIAEKEDPPSLPLVKELVELYPQVDVQIIIGAQSIGVNPKINNSARGYESAKYDLIWFSDANILSK